MARVGLFAALWVASFSLSLALATWGPGDLWPNLATAFSESGIDRVYGSAPNALLRLLTVALPATYETTVWVNLVLGAFAPLLAFQLVREFDPRPAVGWFASFAVLLQPLYVRHAGGASRQVFVLILALAALFFFARYLRRVRGRDLLAGALAATLCHQSRPEALMILPAVGLLLLVRADWAALIRSPRRSPLPAALLALAAAGLVSVLGHDATNSAVPWSELHNLDTDVATSVLQVQAFLNPMVTSVASIALIAVGLLVGLVRRSSLAIWGGLALVALAWVVGGRPVGSLPHLAYARYHTIPLLVATLVSALGAVELASWRRLSSRARRIAAVALCTALLATTVPPLLGVTAPRTIDREFLHILDVDRQLPKSSVVYTVRNDGVDGLGIRQLADRVPLVSGSSVVWRYWPPEEGVPLDTAVYYQSTVCATAQGEREEMCREARKRFPVPLSPITHLAARAYGPEDYPPPKTLPVGFFVSRAATGRSGTTPAPGR